MNDKQKNKSSRNTPCHIEGISCSVKNCIYHDGECYCTTDEICVGPGHATSSGDTSCATFKPKSF